MIRHDYGFLLSLLAALRDNVAPVLKNERPMFARPPESDHNLNLQALRGRSRQVLDPKAHVRVPYSNTLGGGSSVPRFATSKVAGHHLSDHLHLVLTTELRS